MKRFHIYQLITGCVVFLTLWLLYPNILRSIEEQSFFVFTNEYTTDVMGRETGVAFWLTNFIEQFFSFPWLGALIFSVILLLVAEFSYLTLFNQKRESFFFVVPLAVFSLAYFSFPDIVFIIYVLFFSMFVYIYTLLKNKIVRFVYSLVLAVFAYSVMPWSVMVVLFLSFAVLELFVKKSKITFIGMFIPVGISLVMPKVWSDVVSFIPFVSRPFNGLGYINIKIFIIILILGIVFSLPYRFKMKKTVEYVAVLIFSFAFVFLIHSKETHTYIEKMYKISFMADNKDWEKILSEITYEDYTENKAFRSYALLAESALGTLPQNIMKYSINDPEKFLFRHQGNLYLMNFNRQFYDNLEIWDEAFRMAFEFGVNSREMECFKSIRYKIDYALASYDLGLAETYIDLLKHSCANGDFIDSRSAKLKLLKKKKRPERPYRSDTYVGTYPMPSEFFRLYEQDKNNRKKLDYVLCSLLLQKEVVKFGIILQNFNLYKGEELPRVYAEAAAVLTASDPKWKSADLGKFDHNLENRYKDCLMKSQQGESCSEYIGSYWDYLLFHDVPKIQNNDSQKR